MKLWLDKIIPFFFKFRENPNQVAERAMEKHNDPGTIKYLGDGFVIRLDDTEKRISWNEITHITAFKIDLMTTDEICVEVKMNDTSFVLTEGSPGFDYWLTKMEENLENVNEEWYAQVTKQPFETPPTLIYQHGRLA